MNNELYFADGFWWLVCDGYEVSIGEPGQFMLYYKHPVTGVRRLVVLRREGKSVGQLGTLGMREEIMPVLESRSETLRMYQLKLALTPREELSFVRWMAGDQTPDNPPDLTRWVEQISYLEGERDIVGRRVQELCCVELGMTKVVRKLAQVQRGE